jgi:structural toxin protein (hemagglutinin/hemolysin) RtxA
MIKLVFYVPLSHKEKVKNALFEIGAGSMKSYDRCSFETEGAGQFRPLAGATPFLGNIEKLEKVREYKVELVLKREIALQAKEILLAVHPYEAPAYEFYEILKI